MVTKKEVFDKEETGKITPLITVITIVYNDEANIENTIKSVLDQGYEKLEYIIIDGGSTDGTIQIIKKYQHQIKYWVSEPDKGIYDAMNKGILMAGGDVIGLLNCGDTYEPNALSLVAESYDRAKKYCVYYGDVYFNYIDLGIKVKTKAILKNIYYSMSICHQSIFITNQAYVKYGVYNIKYKYSADYEYVLKLFLDKVSFVYLKDAVACFATGGTSDKKVFDSRVERIKAQFELKNPKKVKAIYYSFKEIAYQYIYNIMVMALGEKSAANYKKKRLRSKLNNNF